MKGKRGGSLPKKDSIPQLEGGFARISVGRQTHTWLKQAAGGDESLAKCIRRLVLRELDEQKVSPVAIGFGRESAANTLASLNSQLQYTNAELSTLRANTVTRDDYNFLELLICDIANAVGIEVLHLGIRDKLRKLARSIADTDSSQVELNLSK